MSNNHPYATQFTRTGKVNMQNRKPYRTAGQKALARSTARKGDDGTYHSSSPVSFHSAPRAGRGN
ncbi:hypothetical protein D3Y55_21345 [Mesorhizobium sp. DCY119]|nr:hypothetical protein D3Y55_21345 [Mesorhizobium sp. DCY119]